MRALRGVGMPPDDAPVMPNGRGEPWADYDWDNWRSRTFRAAARAAGLRADKGDGARRVRPRDLRSSFATLLIYEGSRRSTSPSSSATARPLLRDYARVWEDFDPSQRVSAEEQIERVRRRLHRAPTAQRAKRGSRRRAQSAFPKGGRVPQVFRDASTRPRSSKEETAE